MRPSSRRRLTCRDRRRKRNEIGGPARCVPALVVVGTACMVWLLSGGAPGAYAAEAVVTNQLSDSVSFVDLASDKTIAHVKVGGKPAGVALSADRTRAYVTAPETGELIELDTVRRTVSRRLKVSGGPLGVAAHPSRAEVYVADWYAHKIVIVDGTTLTAVAEKSSRTIAVEASRSPDGMKLVSADRDNQQISIVDLATRTVVAVVPVGARPFGVTISADGALLPPPMSPATTCRSLICNPCAGWHGQGRASAIRDCVCRRAGFCDRPGDRHDHRVRSGQPPAGSDH